MHDESNDQIVSSLTAAPQRKPTFILLIITENSFLLIKFFNFSAWFYIHLHNTIYVPYFKNIIVN